MSAAKSDALVRKKLGIEFFIKLLASYMREMDMVDRPMRLFNLEIG